jgi:inositol 3-alpha-galactosyltransferase
MADSSQPSSGKNAYVTLLTRPSYLAGAILLAYTLNKHSPHTPLIITYTPETLPEPSVQAFRDEAKHSNIILHPGRSYAFSTYTKWSKNSTVYAG